MSPSTTSRWKTSYVRSAEKTFDSSLFRPVLTRSVIRMSCSLRRSMKSFNVPPRIAHSVSLQNVIWFTRFTPWAKPHLTHSARPRMSPSYTAYKYLARVSHVLSLIVWIQSFSSCPIHCSTCPYGVSGVANSTISPSWDVIETIL